MQTLTVIIGGNAQLGIGGLFTVNHANWRYMQLGNSSGSNDFIQTMPIKPLQYKLEMISSHAESNSLSDSLT